MGLVEVAKEIEKTKRLKDFYEAEVLICQRLIVRMLLASENGTINFNDKLSTEELDKLEYSYSNKGIALEK